MDQTNLPDKSCKMRSTEINASFCLHFEPITTQVFIILSNRLTLQFENRLYFYPIMTYFLQHYGRHGPLYPLSLEETNAEKFIWS